jgi:hypothetical protein
VDQVTDRLCRSIGRELFLAKSHASHSGGSSRVVETIILYNVYLFL